MRKYEIIENLENLADGEEVTFTGGDERGRTDTYRRNGDRYEALASGNGWRDQGWSECDLATAVKRAWGNRPTATY